MRRRTTFRTHRIIVAVQRRLRAARVYRWPLHPNEEAQHHIAPRVIGAALSDPTEGMRSLSRVGVTLPLTRWQRWLLKIPYKRTLRMQRYILRNLKKSMP